MWHIAIPLVILLLVLLFPVRFKEGYDDYLANLLKERGYEGAKSTPTVEYNTKTGQWEATDPKYQSYAKQLQEKYGSFGNAVTAIQTAKDEASSYETPPDSKYSDKDKELPFKQISGRTSDTKADTTASSDLDTFFKSPAGTSSTDIEKILKLLAERDALTSGKKTSTTGTGTTGTGTTGTSSSEKGTGTTDKGATQTSTGTSTNLPISGKDFYSQFKPMLQQDIETTVKNEIQKQYAENPVLGDDPSEECY